MSRVSAARYAQEKPQACRRALSYLPYAEYRSSKGAWLASAIRDEYGPPPGFERARAAEEAGEKRRSQEEARQAAREELERANATRLRLTLAQLESADSEPLRAFNEYVGRERERLMKMAGSLSAKRQEELLQAFESPEERLRLLDGWLKRERPMPRMTTS